MKTLIITAMICLPFLSMAQLERKKFITGDFNLTLGGSAADNNPRSSNFSISATEGTSH